MLEGTRMNEQEQGQLALLIAETQRLLWKFWNSNSGLTRRLQNLIEERTNILAKAGGLRLLPSAHFAVFADRNE